ALVGLPCTWADTNPNTTRGLIILCSRGSAQMRSPWVLGEPGLEYCCACSFFPHMFLALKTELGQLLPLYLETWRTLHCVCVGSVRKNGSYNIQREKMKQLERTS